MEKIKTVILAGGQGTRLREETEFKPKPMVQIGNRPILWHILKIYSHYGFNNFIICLGYKSEVIKEYFLNYDYMNNDIAVKTGKTKSVKILENEVEEGDWEITLANTGILNMTGSRVRQIEKYVGRETFFLTYGDGVADIDLKALLEFHRSHGKIATISGVYPPSRFGELFIEENRVVSFEEKPQSHSGCINGGFFVFEKEIFDYLSFDENCYLEREPMERLAEKGELMVYFHKGFWQCMDTQRDVVFLDSLCNSNQAPWINWS